MIEGIHQASKMTDDFALCEGSASLHFQISSRALSGFQRARIGIKKYAITHLAVNSSPLPPRAGKFL